MLAIIENMVDTPFGRLLQLGDVETQLVDVNPVGWLLRSSDGRVVGALIIITHRDYVSRMGSFPSAFSGRPIFRRLVDQRMSTVVDQ